MHEIVVSNFNFKSIEKEKAFKNLANEFSLLQIALEQ